MTKKKLRVSNQNQKYYLEYLKRTKYFPQSIYHKAKHNYVERLFKSAPHKSLVLDAGCGIGNITAKYCHQYLIVGVDEQPSAVEYCRQHYSGKYIKADLYNLPLKNNTFDLVLFLDTIEHLSAPSRVLEELARVLKPKGKILICTINYANPLWLILENTWHRFFAGNCKVYSKETHPTRYTAKLLRQQCKGLFKEISLEKRVLKMELFYIGRKP